ncbi:MAG: type I secretion system permease/ATPase, partial [Bauldia litoralis]
MKLFAHKRKSEEPETPGFIEPDDLTRRIRRAGRPAATGDDAATAAPSRLPVGRQPGGDEPAPSNPLRNPAPGRPADPGATLRGAEPPVRHLRNAANDVGTGQARTISFPSRVEEPHLKQAYEAPRGPRLGGEVPQASEPGDELVLGRDTGTHNLDAAPGEPNWRQDPAAAPPTQPARPAAASQISIREHPQMNPAEPPATAPRAAPPNARRAPVADRAVPPQPAPAHAGATRQSNTAAQANPAQPSNAPAQASTPAQASAQTSAPAQPVPEARMWQGAGVRSQRDDPLLDCLVIVTAIFERPQSADALSAGLPLVDGKLTPELFLRAAERAGLSSRIVRRKLDDISNLSLPAVLLLKEGKACILVRKRDDGRAAVVLPETGHGVSEISLDTLATQYAGHAIFARPEFQFDQRSEATEFKPNKSWFWGTLRQFWRVYAQVGIAALFVNLFALAAPLFTMNVYDRVVPTKGQETLWVLVIGVITIFFFEFVLRNLRAYFVDTAGRSADVIMGGMIFQQILGIRMSARPPSAGAFANQLREFETLRDFFTSATLVTLIDLPFVFLFIGIIFVIGGPVAFVPLAAVPIVIGCGLILQVPLTKIVSESAKESAQKHALLVESIVGLETIKSLGAEGRTQRNWERFVGESSRSSAKARTLSQLAMFITTLTTQVTTIAVVVVGVYQIFGGDMTVGALIACTILSGRAMAPLGQIAAIMTRFNQSMVSLRTLDKVMKMPVERPQGAHFVHRPDLRGAIEFKDVTFTYPNQQVKALDNVSFAIKAGEKVGIIGKIGSGKSTIERLSLGLYQPDEGAIRIDGTDIQQVDPADLRRNIGYVSQDIFLFFGSVRDNIAVGAPYADDAAILRAARISGADNFIS